MDGDAIIIVYYYWVYHLPPKMTSKMTVSFKRFSGSSLTMAHLSSTKTIQNPGVLTAIHGYGPSFLQLSPKKKTIS
jgi:hypothetical protein